MGCVSAVLLLFSVLLPSLEYHTPGGKGAIGVDLGVSDFESEITEETDTAYRLAFRGGYRLTRRFELEGDLAVALSDDGSACLATLLVDGVLGFRAGKGVQPYMLAGIGPANLDLDGDDDTGFAWKAGTGMRLYPGRERKVAMRLEVAAVSDRTFGASHLSKNLLLGVTW